MTLITATELHHLDSMAGRSGVQKTLACTSRIPLCGTRNVPGVDRRFNQNVVAADKIGLCDVSIVF
ncbi:hypothetical protein BaRGS_00021901, partial [Batillaria attramentaria]